MGLKEWAFGKFVAKNRSESLMGKLGAGPKAVWGFLDGWKTFIWAAVMAAKIAWPTLPVWGLVDSAASAIGWNNIAPAIDPNALVEWGTFAIATGHKVAKAVAQYRAGVPVADLQSEVEPAVVAAVVAKG